MYRGRVVDLGITSNGGRSHQSHEWWSIDESETEKEESATSYAKEKKEKDGMEWAMNKEKKRKEKAD